MYDPKEVFSLVDQLAPGMGVDPRVAKMLIGAEQVHLDRTTGGYKMPAQFSPRASYAGAQGVGQVMPATLQALQKQGHLPANFVNDGSLQSQVLASLAAIKEMAPRAGGDPLRLAAMYNGGTAAGKAYGTDAFASAPRETQNHVEKAKFMLQQLNEDQSQAETGRLAGTAVRGAAPQPGQQQGQQAGNSSLPFNIPGMDGVLALFGNVSAGTDAAIGGLQGYQAEANTGLQQATMAVAAQAEAEKKAALARIDQHAILETRKNTIADMFGASEEQQLQLREAYVANEAARSAIESQVNEQMAVGFFDNPLQYLANLTTLPGLVAKHNSMAVRSNDMQAEIARRQINAQQQTQTTAAQVNEAYSREQLAAADATAAKALGELARLRTENAGTNAKNLLAVVSAETGRLQTAAQLEALMRQQRQQDAEFLKLTKKEQEDTIEVDKINAMLAPLGGNLDKRLWKEMNAAQKYPLTQLTTRGSYGNSLAEAYTTITDLGLYNRSKADPAMAGFIEAISAELPKRIEALRKQDVLGKEKPAALQAAALAQIEAEWKAPLEKGADRERFNTGPYALDYNVAQLENRYKGTFIGDTLDARAKQDVRYGAGSLTFADMEDAALIQIKAGKLTPAQAAKQLANFYATEQQQKYKALGLGLYNMPKPEGYTVYGFAPGSGFFRTPLQLDAANPAALENYFMTRQVQQLRNEKLPSMFNPEGLLGNPAIR